jgi:hypothetical protein
MRLSGAGVPQVAAELHLVERTARIQTARMSPGGLADNIGVLTSQPLPIGGHIDQADAFLMAMFASHTGTALELARPGPGMYKFFEHFICCQCLYNMAARG